MNGKRFFIAAALWSAFMASICSAATFHHQGVVAVQGQRFTGQGLFRFALVDPGTNAYVWTSDGSAVVHPDPPTVAVSLTTINGVYNVLLGDPTLSNMTAIPDSVFVANDNVVLRLWFDDGSGNGVHRLTPDVAITPAPYAVRASRSDALGVPESVEAAVVVETNGDVSVQSGDLRVVGGNVTIDGDLTVAGSITNFTVAGPFQATQTGVGNTLVELTDFATSFCAVTKVRTSIDGSADFATCDVREFNGRWALVANVSGFLLQTGLADCRAYCFSLEGQ